MGVNPPSVHPSRLKSNDYLRRTYLDTQDKCYKLLDTLRVGNAYYPDAIYENGAYRRLTEEELQARWLLLSDNVNKHSKRTYKRPNKMNAYHVYGVHHDWHFFQPEISRRYIDRIGDKSTAESRYHRHIERMLTLADFIMYYPVERADGQAIPIQKVMASYGFKFRLLDLMRQYKFMGVSISDLPARQAVTRRNVKDLTKVDEVFKLTDDENEAIRLYSKRTGESMKTARRKVRDYMAVSKALDYDTFFSLENFLEDMGDVIDDTGFLIEGYNQLPSRCSE